MTVSHIEFLVEEPSMEAALRLIIPKIIKDISFEVHPFQCKEDLLKKLPERLLGYAKWLPNDYRIVVIVDQDDDDCKKLKNQLEKAVLDAKLVSRSKAKEPNLHNYQVVNRLANEELETWYFGDWEAVMAAYPKVKKNIPKQAKYRNPDAIVGGTWESFEKILKNAGYFKTGLRKIEAAKSIAKHMNPMSNRSHSFGVFRDAIIELAQ